MQLVAKTDTAFLNKLDGIGHQIDDEMSLVTLNEWHSGSPLKGEGDILLAIVSARANFWSFFITLFNSKSVSNEFHCAYFSLSQVQNFTDELQQQSVLFTSLMRLIFVFFLLFGGSHILENPTME